MSNNLTEFVGLIIPMIFVSHRASAILLRCGTAGDLQTRAEMVILESRSEPLSVPAGGVFRLPDPEVFKLVEDGLVNVPSLEALLDWLECDT